MQGKIVVFTLMSHLRIVSFICLRAADAMNDASQCKKRILKMVRIEFAIPKTSNIHFPTDFKNVFLLSMVRRYFVPRDLDNRQLFLNLHLRHPITSCLSF